MWDVFAQNPWLIICVVGCMVPICGIIFNSITGYLLKARRAELDTSLKHEMLQRGMSADDIVRVLEARSYGSKGKEGSGPNS
jgi:hypothetical protein